MNEKYDPNAVYWFIDRNGNKIESSGDNGYIQQAYTQGVPINTTDEGEWFVTPFISSKDGNVTVHMPNWFKNMPEYNEWLIAARQTPLSTLTQETLEQSNRLLKALGNQGATRMSNYNDIKRLNVTDQNLIDKYANGMQAIFNEGGGGGDSPISLLGKDYSSIADVAREYKDKSKDELSATLSVVDKIIDQSEKGTYTDQSSATDALLTRNILTIVGNNPDLFGNKDEFKGLLDASLGQQLNNFWGTAAATFAQSNVFGTLFVRPINALVHGLDTPLEDTISTVFANDPKFGYGLSNLEVAQNIGTGFGVAANVAATVVLSKGLSKINNTAVTAANPGFYGKLVSGLDRVGGFLATDFFLNDVPIDAAFAITKAARGENWWLDTERTQPLIKTPLGLVGFEFGPQVPDGMMWDLIGDAIVDIAPEVISVSAGVTYRTLDDVTGGGISRMRESAAIKGWEIQDKLKDTPVVGKAWQGMVNKVMTAPNAALIREAKKTAIADGSTDWYVKAQNQLTLENQHGAQVVGPKVAKLDSDFKISKTIETFNNNANKYGGFGKTVTKIQDATGGVAKTYTRTVDADLPKQVDRGLKDIERLAELEGQKKADGGLPFNPQRETEIENLRGRVEKIPKEIKDFADRFSEYNRAIERLAGDLGVKDEDWIAAIQLDPQYAKYMVRQALIPYEPQSGTGATDLGKSAIWSKSRTGEYNVDALLTPTQALALKVEALGRAYAWNERKKLLAEMALVQKKVLSGGDTIELGKRIEKVRADIANSKAIREETGYDSVIGGYSTNTDILSNSFVKINDLFTYPQDLVIKSVYDAVNNPRIKSIVNDFSNGKISFAEGVAETSGLTDAELGSIINNTYAVKGMEAIRVSGGGSGGGSITGDIVGSVPRTVNSGTAMEYDVPSSSKVTPSTLKYNAGVTTDGRPFKYTIENGKITSLEEITDNEEWADSINHFGGVYRISPETIDKIGSKNAAAINRTILYYREEMPSLGIGPTYKAVNGDGAYGWIPTPGHSSNSLEYGFHLDKDGHIQARETPVYLELQFHGKGKEDYLLSEMADDVNARFHPKNSAFLENVPIHETGHNYMARLAILEVNRKIDEGIIKVDESTNLDALVYDSWKNVHEIVVKNALESMGIKFSDVNWQQQALTISRYAGTGDYQTKTYRYETISEAQVDFKANRENAAPFTLAVLEQVKKMGERFTVAAAPGEVMAKNGLDPAKVTKNGEYAFPKGVKTDAQKAKWLDKQRQNNPYLGEKLTDDTYQKANLWDTYFQKEISAYNPKTKTSMPDKLVKMNSDFLEELSATAAKRITTEIRQAGVEGFTEEIATLAFSKNTDDLLEALDTFVIGKVNDAAQEIAKKLPGGATPDNLTRARATVWSEPAIKTDTIKLVDSFVPGLTTKAITDKVNTLFDDQIKGFSSMDRLGVDMADLLGEKKKLISQINSRNRRTKAFGKKVDEGLEGWTKDTTQVISYKAGGQDIYVVVDDPVVAGVLKKPYNYKETGIVGETANYVANFVSRAYRLGTTGINPNALIRNYLRDPIQATITAGFNPLSMTLDPQAFYRSLRQFGLDDKTIADVTSRLRTWAESSTLSYEMKKMNLPNPNSMGYRNNAEKAAKEINKKVFDNKIVNAAEAPLEVWEGFLRNQIAQQSFEKNLRRTGSVDKAMSSAMFDASNATTNFSHAIGSFSKITSTVPYLSSAINGTTSFWRLFQLDPVGVTARITAGFMVPAMAITAWNLSSEERRKAYMNLPEWYRDGHIVLVDLNGGIVSFPIPDEIGNYYGTARRLIEYTNEVNSQGIPSIMLQGAFGFLPVDVDGFFNDDGSIDLNRGAWKMMSGLIPQAVTAIYEFAYEQDMYTGADLSGYTTINKWVNTLSNVFGSGVKNVVNDIGFLLGVPSNQLVGKGTAETLARDLFGVGFNEATNQFMALVGRAASFADDGKEIKATGLFAENEALQKQLEKLTTEIAFASEDEKPALEKKKQELVDNFVKKVANLTNKYMQLYSQTGGLEEWQKKKIIQLLTLGGGSSSSDESTYQSEEALAAYYNERGLAQQRYVDAGLPAGATTNTFLNGQNSIEVQAALNRYYGAPKQAATDYRSAVANTNLKDIKNEFYDTISKIYDYADKNNTDPDYDLIEKIQARYLQAVDAVLVPIVNQYGVAILNNADFIDAVRKQVNGMIPSDDWRQSVRNAKKFLSSKDFPTATVDVKKWLIKRYSSSMRDRGIDSDPEVATRLNEIKADIDAGRMGQAQGKINSLTNSFQRANLYISRKDLETLSNYNNMVK